MRLLPEAQVQAAPAGPCGLMPVPVVDIRVMRVTVPQRLMAVKMAVGFAAVPGEIVRMPVMCVVHVPVPVREGGMGMQVFMAFRKV